jgi:hypothetical protein
VSYVAQRVGTILTSVRTTWLAGPTVEASPDVMHVAATSVQGPSTDITVCASLTSDWRTFVGEYVAGIRLSSLVVSGWSLLVGDGCADSPIPVSANGSEVRSVHSCTNRHEHINVVAHLAAIADDIGISSIGMLPVPHRIKVDLCLSGVTPDPSDRMTPAIQGC